MKRILILILLFLLLASPAWPAAIDYTFVEQNTAQTRTGATTFADISGVSIASGNFTTGKKYLLFSTAQCKNDNAAGQCQVQLAHGGVAFAETQQNFVPGVIERWGTYGDFTVWTAVSGEAISLQHATPDSTHTTTTDQASLLKINLSDNLTENTDWFFAERSTDDTLSATPTNGASITFTPATAGDTWLIVSSAQIDPVGVTDTLISRIDRSGEASSSTPTAQLVMTAVADLSGITQAKCLTLGAASNTFTEVSASGATDAHIRKHSKILAVNVSKFKNFVCASTDADLALSATDYATELQTASITPSVAGDVWIVASWGADQNAVTRTNKFRIQVDGADQPAGQTTDNYIFNHRQESAADEEPMILSTLVNMTAAAHTVDLDASINSTTSTPTGQYRTIIAMTMELVAATRRPIPPVIFP